MLEFGRRQRKVAILVGRIHVALYKLDVMLLCLYSRISMCRAKLII
jgi:hypothetical protein